MDPILLILGFIGFAIISAISNILEKKKRREEEEEARRTGQPIPPRSAGPQGPASMSEWQEQLRRMLNPEAGPPPPIIHPPPRAELQRPAPSAPPPVRQSGVPQTRPVASMRPSQALYEKASQLQKQVARRVQAIEQKRSDIQREVKSGLPDRPVQRVRPKPLSKRPVSTRGAVSLVRNHHTIRDAFVASVILGPPKAMETGQRPV